MQTYSCFTFVRGESVPGLSFIVAASLDRARELARRELISEGGVSFEICDGQTLLWSETAERG